MLQRTGLWLFRAAPNIAHGVTLREFGIGRTVMLIVGLVIIGFLFFPWWRYHR
jgi:hypothetical protein